MTRRPSRGHLPERDDTHRKRSLMVNPSRQDADERFINIKYECYGKHKANPYLYSAAPYHGTDSDRTLCDEHAQFQNTDIQRIPSLLGRARDAPLFGNLIWTIDDNGWIYELAVTNSGHNTWHGYPLLPRDRFARQVWERFDDWAAKRGGDQDRLAARHCASLYGFLNA